MCAKANVILFVCVNVFITLKNSQVVSECLNENIFCNETFNVIWLMFTLNIVFKTFSTAPYGQPSPSVCHPPPTFSQPS